MPDTYTVIIDNKRVEKEIETFQDVIDAWETGQLSGKDAPNYISSREEAKLAFEVGILDKKRIQIL